MKKKSKILRLNHKRFHALQYFVETLTKLSLANERDREMAWNVPVLSRDDIEKPTREEKLRQMPWLRNKDRSINVKRNPRTR